MQPLIEDNDIEPCDSSSTMMRASHLMAPLPVQSGNGAGLAKPHVLVSNGNITFLSWLRHPQRGLPYLICSILVILIILPFCIHYYLSSFAAGVGMGSALEGLGKVAQRMGQSKLMSERAMASNGHVDEFGGLKLSDARYQIDELRNIRASVNNELMDLEKKRRNLQSELNSYRTAIDGLKTNHGVAARELERIRVTLRNLELHRKELSQENIPYIEAPKPIFPSDDSSLPYHSSSEWFDSSQSTSSGASCRLHNCFDYSRCSLTSGFNVYLYDPLKYYITTGSGYSDKDWGKDSASEVIAKVAAELNRSPYITDNPKIACIYVVLVGPSYQRIDSALASSIKTQLQMLPYWHADGANHVIIGLTRSTNDSVDLMTSLGDMGRAIFAQSVFGVGSGGRALRDKFDVVTPPWYYGLSTNDPWQKLSMIVPARRQYLISFTGEFYRNVSSLKVSEKSWKNIPEDGNDNGHADGNWKGFEDEDIWRQRGLRSARVDRFGGENRITSFESEIVDNLKTIQSRAMSDHFRFEFSCGGSFENDNKMSRISGEWLLCGTETTRMETLRGSTFALIIATQTSAEHSVAPSVLVRLLESLQSGAVPVILGADRIFLPFADIIDWGPAIISLPAVRLPEMYYYIKTITDADIIEMRRRGRIIYETYLGTTSRLVESLLGNIRTRLSIPPTAMLDEPSTSVFNGTFQPLREPVVDALSEQDEMLGPVEPPLDSPRFLRNFTASGLGSVGRKEFLPGMDPFHNYPYMPFDPVLPADAKFIGSSYGFRPIGEGVGGAGKEFGEALGGNNMREQFTVVILTYEREAVLLSAVARLKGLPHLHSVVVVWNSLRPPNPDLRWPDIGVDVHVIRTKVNSLNNRFLPYDVIKTEAVLSLDDDAHLRHDEILFAFRVWRESRDRIVGFPGRYNSWDMKGSNWLYNSNYSCELSLVLTGAAFFHKYYMYLYSYVMPQSIRDKVDEYLNCEDLAMNFLVSHITRKPPVKVTSRWTFRCPGCPSALSVEESHFNERHKCMNFFVRVYGYMPLLNTQHRADSVLFKTRIPHDKQKCFKFI